MCFKLVDALNISEVFVGVWQRVAHVIFMHLCGWDAVQLS